MSALEEELEEGEITDSDSMGDEESKPNGGAGKTLVSSDKSVAVKQYSVFSSSPRPAQTFQPITRPPNSDSDPSDSESSEGDSDDDPWVKKIRFHAQGDQAGSKQAGFVNPNFLKNGGVMPPLPKLTSRNMWGSVMQEQILTSEVGGFTMERKVQSDRDVESYDYTRAANDDRPNLEDTETDPKEDELFSEVIDLDRAAAAQRHSQNRKRVRDRLGRKHNLKDRLHHGRGRCVTEDSSVEEVVYHISKQLLESKVHLIRRVVQEVGRAKALNLLRQTDEMEEEGGMMTMNGARRRTPGGVFLQLLKTDPDVTKQQHDKIFEEENRWFQEQKKRKRAKARQRKRQQLGKPGSKGDNTQPGDAAQSGTMETEDAATFTDTQRHNTAADGAVGQVGDIGENGGQLSGSAGSDSGEVEDESNSDSHGSFGTELQQELKRQARERSERSEVIGQCDVDVLQIEAEDDDILD